LGKQEGQKEVRKRSGVAFPNMFGETRRP